MNISKRHAWQSVGNCRENSPLLPQSLRGLVIGKSGCGKTTVVFNLLLQPGWLDYNHLYIFGKSLHQQEYKILRNGFEGGLRGRIHTHMATVNVNLTLIFKPTHPPPLTSAHGRNIVPFLSIPEYNLQYFNNSFLL